MRVFFAIAAFLLASSAAQAQYSFDYGGRTIRIDPDRGTISYRASTTTLDGRPSAHVHQDYGHTTVRATRPSASKGRSAGGPTTGAMRGPPPPRPLNASPRAFDCHGQWSRPPITLNPASRHKVEQNAAPVAKPAPS